MGWALSDRAARKLNLLLQRTPDPDPNRPGRGGSIGRLPLIVRCTDDEAADATAIGSQCYPAVIVAADGDTATQPELGAVWLTVLGSNATAETPTVDALYYGMLSGDYDDGDGPLPRVFAVATQGSSLASDEVTPGDTYTLTSTSAWLDTGWDITLPSAGTYIVTYDWVTNLEITSGSTLGRIHARLYDETAAAAVADAVVFCCSTTGAVPSIATQNILTKRVVVDEASTMRLEVQRGGISVTFTTSNVTMASPFGAGFDQGRINYVQIA